MMKENDLSNQNSTMKEYAEAVFNAIGIYKKKLPEGFPHEFKIFDYYHAGITATAAVAIEREQFRKGQR